MIKPVFSSLLTIALLVNMVAGQNALATPTSDLLDLRLGKWNDRQRLVLESDRALIMQIEASADGTSLSLHNPDLDKTILLDFLQRALHQFPDGFVTGASIQGDEVRLLFARPVELKNFSLAPMEGFAHRWVLDIFPRPKRQINAARLGEHPQRTRIVLESKQPMQPTLVMLGQADKLVLELPGLQPGPELDKLGAELAANHTLLRDIRLQQGAEGEWQLVIELLAPARADMFTLAPFGKYGHRLVLDIFAAGPSLPRTKIASASETDQPPSSESEQQLAKPSETIKPSSTEPAAPEAKAPIASAARESWLAVTLNGQDTSQVTLALLDPDGSLWIDGQDLRRWRLLEPLVAAREHLGGDYYPLHAMDGLDYRLDEEKQSLNLQVPAPLFEKTVVSGRDKRAWQPDPVSGGAYLNYDIFAVHEAGESEGKALLDFGGFASWGSFSTNALAKTSSTGDGDVVRLDSAWIRDDPQRLLRLRLGDSVTQSTAWGGAIRFGGLQWGRAFSTQPGFITMPLPGVSGEAVLPTTVDLYVNEALRMRRELPAGPFELEDLPVITGRGEAKLVLRDILGREQIIVQDFSVHRDLLRKGLHDFSYAAGLVRENYGQHSSDYGRTLLAGGHRMGLSESFTAELAGQWLEGERSAGAGFVWALPFGANLSSSLASSHSARGNGSFASLGLEQWGHWWSWGLQSQFASQDFVSPGSAEHRAFPRRQHHAHVNVAGAGLGSWSLGYTLRDYRDYPDYGDSGTASGQADVEFFSASYQRRVGRSAQLAISALHTPHTGDTSVILNLSMPLGMERSSVNYAHSSAAESTQETLQMQRNLPIGNGFGYQLQAGRGESDYQQLGLSARTSHGTYELSGARRGEQLSYQLRGDGALLTMDGHWLHGRRLGDSFGLVNLPGFANVRVYAEHQEIGRTDARGLALVPQLRPYERNRITIESADIPLTADVGAMETLVVPRWRSGSLARFHVVDSRSALLRVVLDDGRALPVGSRVQVNGSDSWLPVGRNGEVYLAQLMARNRVTAQWAEGQCQFAFELADDGAILPHLGEFLCE